MKKYILLLILQAASVALFSQISTDPPFPGDNQPLTIIFYAQEGNKGLAGYSGEVYAHTGVITNLSNSPSDWKHVKNDWGENTPDTKLERIGTDIYRFTTGSQSISEFYGVPSSEEILQVAFVFRSASPVNGNYLQGKTNTNSDIFAPVYADGLYVRFDEPLDYANLVEAGQNLAVEAVANNADSLILFIDNSQVYFSLNESLVYSFNVEQQGKHYIKIKAVYGNEVAYDSAYYFIKSNPQLVQMPENVQNGINYINDSTVILSIYAPSKDNIFVLGDFNNWEYSEEGEMYKDVDSPNWWRQIAGLQPGKEYVFQYWVDQIVVADPYADKYLDPWNDKYISDITYPGLLEFPHDKTSQYASVLQTAQPEYQWMNDSFTPPAKTDLVIYELLLRDFIAAHDFQTLIDTLGYLKRLGVNVIELMPVYEFEGNSSWGYNTAFHFAPDKYYGNKNDLKQFIDICHQEGIAVILDIVLNHVFGSSPFARLYWDSNNNKPSADNPWLNPDARHPFNVGFDFNHESSATKELTNRVVKYWIEDYKVDGYRFDLSKGFTQTYSTNDDVFRKYDASRIATLKRIADTIWSKDQDFYVILEHFAENSEEKELANYGMMLWGNLNQSFRQIAMGYSDNSNTSWLSYKERGWNNPHVIGYMESHDEERLMFSIKEWGNMDNPWYNIKNADTAIQRIIAASAFFYTIPGPKMIWQFGELGYDYSIDYNGRVGEKPIKWDYYDDWRRNYLYRMTSALINLKKEQDVFRTSDFSQNVTGLLKSVNLRSQEMSVTVIGNFDIKENELTPGFNLTGTWYDYFKGDSLIVTSLTDKILLKPGEFRLYTSKKLIVPETGLALPEKNELNDKILGGVFPNPAFNQIDIPVQLKKNGMISIEIYTSTGKRVKTVPTKMLTTGKHIISTSINELENGLYILRLLSNDKIETTRFIIAQ